VTGLWWKKTIAVSVVLLFTIQGHAQETSLTWNTLISVARSRISDGQILEQVRQRGLDFDLTLKQMHQLNLAGRSDDFLAKLVKTAKNFKGRSYDEDVNFIPIEKRIEQEKAVPAPKPTAQPKTRPAAPKALKIGSPVLDPTLCASMWKTKYRSTPDMEDISVFLSGIEKSDPDSLPVKILLGVLGLVLRRKQEL